jgi:RNA polymerase sigma-70 factor (ECF subfamily)
MSEERQLVERCLAGEQLAMVELVDRFRGPVFGLALRMLGHRHDAEDVCQETFFRAFRSLHTWDSARGFLPWLLAIVGNRCRTRLSQRKRMPQWVELVDEPTQRAGEQGDGGLLEEVTLGLQQLRPEYREAFLLLHQNDLSYPEIAQRLGKPVGTIKTWIHRARRELLEHLRRRQVVEGSTDAMS